MTLMWNVRDEHGEVVEDLDRLAKVLRTTPDRAAKHLLGDQQFYAAAPLALRREAKGKTRPKPGGGTPPPISTGSYVSWDGGKGRVDLIVTSGKVPGVSEDVEGTTDSPAARVVVYEDGKATGKKIGASTHVLKRTAPLASAGKKDAQDYTLVDVLADHEERVAAERLPSYAHVTGYAVKAVYDRGVEAWPGSARTTLTPQQWALGRVDHFVKVAAGDVEPARAGHDVDLLTPEHPLHAPRHTEHYDADTSGSHGSDGIRLDRALVEAQMKALALDLD